MTHYLQRGAFASRAGGAEEDLEAVVRKLESGGKLLVERLLTPLVIADVSKVDRLAGSHFYLVTDCSAHNAFMSKDELFLRHGPPQLSSQSSFAISGGRSSSARLTFWRISQR